MLFKLLHGLKHVCRKLQFCFTELLMWNLYLPIYRISAELSSVLVLKNYWITFLLAKGEF